jgi:hypothetical protein
MDLTCEAVVDDVEALRAFRFTILSEASILTKGHLSGESSNWHSERLEFARFENTEH